MGIFGVVWDFGQKALLLSITRLASSFKIVLKVRSVIDIEVVQLWFIWPIVGLVSHRAASSLSPPSGLRVAMQSFFESSQTYTHPTCIGSCSAIFKIDLLYTTFKTIGVACALGEA